MSFETMVSEVVAGAAHYLMDKVNNRLTVSTETVGGRLVSCTPVLSGRPHSITLKDLRLRWTVDGVVVDRSEVEALFRMNSTEDERRELNEYIKRLSYMNHVGGYQL